MVDHGSESNTCTSSCLFDVMASVEWCVRPVVEVARDLAGLVIMVVDAQGQVEDGPAVCGCYSCRPIGRQASNGRL